MKNIIAFVHTEYHLLLTVNQVLRLYNDAAAFNVELYIRRGINSKRLNQPHDFSGLPMTVTYFDEEINTHEPLSDKARAEIKTLLDKNPDVFIFYQEQDVLMVILAYYFSKRGVDVCLYQDGLKPYNHLQYHSLGLIRADHRQNIWLGKNNFVVPSWLSPVWSKKYAFLKGISKVYLTFPEMYDNWNRKHLRKIEFLPLDLLNPVFKRLFVWDESMLPEREKVIFYMNQPMHDDGRYETGFLRQLENRFPDNPIYIKLHPLTNNIKTEQYKTLKNVKIISSTLPAELFIMNLKESVILSINSTSMFLDNPENRFYYLYRIFEEGIKRLSRWKVKRNPAAHIKVVNSIDEISF
ncbi:MAG: polysialyltransferase family glycosyltransferase [Bacteroidota bacterium]